MEGFITIMKRLIKPIAALLMAGSLIFATPLTASAVIHENAQAVMDQFAATGYEDTSDMTTWYQGRVPSMEGRTLQNNTSTESFMSGGCSYYAAAYMLAAMGYLHTTWGENPLNVINLSEENGLWLSWGKMDYERINEIYPDVTCEGYKIPLSGTAEERIECIKGFIDDGNYVIATIAGGVTTGHYIYIDSVLEDGDMIIGDSAYEGVLWSDTHGPAGAQLIDITVFTDANSMNNNSTNFYVEPNIY